MRDIDRREDLMEEKLIAPCGMNCALCVSYLAMQNDCHNGLCLNCDLDKMYTLQK